METLYLDIKPVAALRDILCNIWVQQTPAGTKKTTPTRVIPSGYAEMTFFYLSPVDEITPSGRRVILPRTSVNGQKSIYRDYHSHLDIGTIILRFSPGGLARILKEPLHSFRDKNVDLRDILPVQRVIDLEDQLQQYSSIHGKIYLVQSFVLELLRVSSKEIDPVVLHCTSSMWGGSKMKSMEDLAKIYGISRRSLELKFRNFIGISPKTYQIITRLQSCLRNCQGHAYLDHFYDQSHFIRSIKKFTGQTPGDFMESRRLTKVGEKFNETSHLYNTVYLEGPSL